MLLMSQPLYGSLLYLKQECFLHTELKQVMQATIHIQSHTHYKTMRTFIHSF
jgi:hypothetical protein